MKLKGSRSVMDYLQCSSLWPRYLGLGAFYMMRRCKPHATKVVDRVYRCLAFLGSTYVIPPDLSSNLSSLRQLLQPCKTCGGAIASSPRFILSNVPTPSHTPSVHPPRDLLLYPVCRLGNLLENGRSARVTKEHRPEVVNGLPPGYYCILCR